jgi:PAS domain S-box-containing protein
MIQELRQLIQLLTNSADFRKNIPEALSLLNQRLGASNALLLEVAPVPSDIPHLTFERILQVPLAGAPQAHTLPDQLVNTSFSANMLEAWFNKMSVFSAVLAPGREEADSNSGIYGTLDSIEKAVGYVDMSVIIKAINISEKTFVLFPLMRGKNAFGCLFFWSYKAPPWDEKAIDLAYSGAALITNQLEQQHTEKKKTFLALEKSKERYQNFINYSSEGIYYTNCGKPISIQLPIEEQLHMFYENAYVEECNLAMAKMYGYESVQDIIGKTIDQFHQGEHYELNRDSFRNIVENNYKVEDTETIELNLKGEKRYFLNRAVSVIEQGYLIGMWGVQRDITEKRQSEITFEKNRSLFSNISKDAKMGLWDWHMDTHTVHVNETYLNLVGFENELLFFDQSKITNLLHPDDLAGLQEVHAYNIEHEIDSYQKTVRLKKSTDEWHWFQIYGRVVEKTAGGTPKRVSGMLLDIHQVKTTEIRLQEGEALLKAVLDAMPDTKLHVKLDGTIIAVYSSPQNKGEQTYFSQEIEGKNLLDIMPVFTAKGLLFNVGKAIKTKSLQSFEYLNVIDDMTYYFEARINQVTEEEAIIILRDITSVKKTENDLNEQIYKHDQNVRELKKYIESNLQLENFAYIASHDLREPLRTMRMFGQFLKKKIGDQLDKENLSYLDFIISGAKRMNELIEGILTYSRVDTDPLEKEVIDTECLIADIIDNLSKAIEKEQATVIIEQVPASIYGSRIRLEQVFQNLIANGIKFSKPNVPPRIVISGYETKTHWVFKVLDNGIGIKKEFFDQIFVLFKKLHNNKDFEGAGIGLALLKRIIEQHQGVIWLESEENVGTTFLFSLAK